MPSEPLSPVLTVHAARTHRPELEYHATRAEAGPGGGGEQVDVGARQHPVLHERLAEPAATGRRAAMA